MAIVELQSIKLLLLIFVRIPSTNTCPTAAVSVMLTFQDPAYTDTQPPYAFPPTPTLAVTAEL